MAKGDSEICLSVRVWCPGCGQNDKSREIRMEGFALSGSGSQESVHHERIHLAEFHVPENVGERADDAKSMLSP